MDNHESHLSDTAIDLARASGVVLVTICPHTSDPLQPLDIGVYVSVKSGYNFGLDTWHSNHPGQTFSIYEIAGVVGSIYAQAFSVSNILSGFRASGIYPLNPNIFPDSAFLCSYVANRSAPEANAQPDVLPNSSSQLVIDSILASVPSLADPQPSTSSADYQVDEPLSTNSTPSVAVTVCVSLTPEDICPYSKTGPRKQSNRGKEMYFSLPSQSFYS